MSESSSTGNTLTEENCQVLYRLPANGEEEAHAHSVTKVTRKEVHVEKAAEDGTMPLPYADPRGYWALCRRELELHGSSFHSNIGARFYLSKEEAETT